jgi:hypothetical protein
MVQKKTEENKRQDRTDLVAMADNSANESHLKSDFSCC